MTDEEEMAYFQAHGSSDCFDRLMQRLRRCEARGEPITLTVR